MEETIPMKANYKYPICPECGCNTIVGFTPPKKGKFGKENIDWERAHLYCCNDANCNFNTRFLDLTTPNNEPRVDLKANQKPEYDQKVGELAVQEYKNRKKIDGCFKMYIFKWESQYTKDKADGLLALRDLIKAGWHLQEYLPQIQSFKLTRSDLDELALNREV